MRIEIERLRVDATIGAYAEERLIEQTLWLDITLDYEAELATASDTFEHAVDYDALTRRLSAYVKESKFVLIETCLLYTSPSPRDRTRSRMPSSA